MYSEKYESIWTRRFINAAIIQGAIIVGLTVFLVLGQISVLKPEVSRVIAAGGAGTWFTFGYLMYVIVGVIGVAVSALFYYYLEKVMGIDYSRSIIAKIMAWIHLLLMNIGAAGVMGLLMYVGYVGGAATLPKIVGGGGLNAAQAHEIIGPFVEPISAAILVLVTGVLAGGIGFLLMYRKKIPGVLQGKEFQQETSSGRGFSNAG
jgi:heme/copper-type cytochrome/quinol oxidase subunit 1